MKTWNEIYDRALSMKANSVFAFEHWETVKYCAPPDRQKLMRILQETIWRCEADRLLCSNDPNVVAECDAKITGNAEMLTWIER